MKTITSLTDNFSKQPRDNSRLVNKAEPKSFLRAALVWHGSVSPRVLPRVIVTALYAIFVSCLYHIWPHFSLPITPFEYSGAVLGLILVLRVNAGQDRWWEARRLWGSIVNQSRNLATTVLAYGHKSPALAKQVALLVAAWPFTMRDSLRQERMLVGVDSLLSNQEKEAIRQASHMPSIMGLKIARLLEEMRSQGLSNAAFHRAETERSLLIDAIGACERIRSTRMPLALAIKTRRFIFLFLLLLPFALVERSGWLAPLVVALAAYPLFSLDEIGAELQNPFSLRNLNHLPLDTICLNIADNIKAMIEDTKKKDLQPGRGLNPLPDRAVKFSTSSKSAPTGLKAGVCTAKEL